MEGHTSGSWLEQDADWSNLNAERVSPVAARWTEAGLAAQVGRRDPETTIVHRRAQKRSLIYNAEKARMDRDIYETNRSDDLLKKQKTEGFSSGWQRNFKAEPYPEKLQSTEKLGAWLDWKRQFKISMELMGEMSQKTKANLLFMSIGNEIRRVIGACGMLKTETEESEDFPFYDDLMDKLEAHFRSSSDTAIDLNVYSTMRQDAKEGASEFLIRLKRQAALCNLQDATELLRNSFIKGMKDQGLAAQAIVGNWSTETLVAAAIRMEAWTDKPGSTRPWPMLGSSTPMLVAAVTQERKGFRSSDKGKPGNGQRDVQSHGWRDGYRS